MKADESWTTSVYTTHIHSTCTKVGSDAPQRRKRVREHRGSLGLLCSPSCPLIDWAVYGSGEAGPGPSLALSAATGAQWRFVFRAAAAVWQSARRRSQSDPRCAPPTPPASIFLASTSVVVMIGDVCAVSSGQSASFAVDIDLWRSSQMRYQRACERGSVEAM